MNNLRLKKLQSSLDCPLLVKKKENLLYLMGRSFMNGALLIKKNDLVFFGDGLERVDSIKKIDRLKNLGKYVLRGSVVQVEDIFTYAEVKYLRLKIKDSRLNIHILRSPVDFLRQIKEAQEIKNIAIASKIVTRVWRIVNSGLRKRKIWTEISLANFIKTSGLKLGAEDVSFSPIVAAGVNAAIPHHLPGNKKLRAGESIIIDFGFKHKNYCSDFTRTVFIKTVPKRLEKAYRQVEKTYQVSIQTARPAIGTRMLYNKAVKVLEEVKLGKYFIHNLGHGVGLEIHELPNLSPDSKDVLKENMVFSIEPGVYLPKVGGIRIEDLVYLDKKGAKKFINVTARLEDNII